MESTQHLRLLALVSFILLLLFTTNASSNNEFRTLLSFKSLISKDPSGVLSSWNPLTGSSTQNGTQGFCRWTGVTCGGRLSPRRVTALRLSGFGLVGTLSPHIGNLTHLGVLDLSHNKFEGDIPPSLASCSVLQELNLSNNSLSGTIPSAMGHLSKLSVFNIGSNNISGLIPPSFENLTALTDFSIFQNSVHGNIPPWLGNLTTLIYLDIQENKMSGHVPPLLSNLVRLRGLGLGANMLEGTIPSSLFNISSLETVNIGENSLSGYLPPDMGFMIPNLRLFYAFDNEFEGPIPFSLSNISLLQTLIIGGNRFRGIIPPNLGINGHLERFAASNCELQASEPRDWDFLTHLANCSKLSIISIGGNNLSGTLPIIIGNLSLELDTLALGSNQIAGHIPTGIGRYYKLTSLRLGGNIFTGTIPSGIGKLSNLRELLLQKNAFHGVIPLSLANITQLNLLSLSSNFLDGGIPVTLGNLSMLTYIDISNNLLSGQIPQEIVSISTLTEMCAFSNNALSGPIPLQIGRLVNLVEIDLSSNKLSGEIPNTIGRCLELQLLYFQGNLLQGQIPEDLIALKGIEMLDFSNNKLSGPIPEFFGTFKLLRSLNLSFNQLSGLVPDKGIFFNASAVSLIGNEALCGGPPFFHYPPCPYPVPSSSAQKHLHTLIFTIVGAFAFAIICIVACYCVKKSRSTSVDSNRDQGLTFTTVMHQRISYTELSVATDSFSAENLIGHGNFSTVYKGMVSFGGHSIHVAVKVLDLHKRGANQSFMSECNALKWIRHRKLIKAVTVCDSLDHNGEEFKALVLEFISNGSLDKWLHSSTESMDKLSMVQRLSIAHDVAEALEYLHHRINPSIAHCDIKPSNILLDQDMTAHLGDLGLAKIMNVGASNQSPHESSSVEIKGTIGYLAPECCMGTVTSTAGDIFSYGVLLLEILTGRRPTDISFHDSTTLPKFVEMAYPDKLFEIMDPMMPQPHNQEQQDIVDLYIAPVSRLGLACCRDSPRQRIKMGEVVKELSNIRTECEQLLK
ncbi:hypothetical protein U9M48_032485 [Paspalum notatum var. saurae]|uniref:Receptor kinase-like protein Xa21 n=1 Tax=Paspalum notatum var. saurae TaxID=547442 RepID=A0AAQ3X4I7_PASNO